MDRSLTSCRAPVRPRAPLVGAFALLGAAVLWAGCGSSGNKAGFDAADASAGGDGASVDAAPTADDGGPGLQADAEAAAPCFACSADLHQVLDCSTPPHVLQTCPADQGCGPNGQCVDPCQAAAANKSSIGCDYYTIPADGWSNIPGINNALGEPSSGSCFAAFVNNTWGIPLKVTLDWKGKTIDATPFSYVPAGAGTSLTYVPVPASGIPAHQMAIVFLNQYGAANTYKALCPSTVHAAIEDQDIGLHGTGFGNALHLSTSAPAVVYDIFPFGGASSYISSATLLLPTPVWDTNYVAVSAWPGFGNNPMDVEVVGMTDGTKVTLLPKAAIAQGGAVPAAPAGQPVTYTLDKGQLLQFAQLADLSGSPIQATNPVGVWGGHYCMTIPDQSTPACDAAHQEIPPVKALGSEYVAVRYRSRTVGEETVPWRIMGMVKGTTLTYDPPVSGAPATLDVGQLVEFSTSQPFAVRSQDDKHPFYLAAHMTGGGVAGANGVGDPETVNVVTPAQYLPSYLFFTDPTYAETNLVVVRGPAQDGSYKDVKLDCLGSTPVPGFTAVGGSKYQYARVDLQRGHMPVGQCDNGLHTIWSDAPFGITVWGFDQYVSYAYPAGASVRPINDVVVPPQPQ